jgi:hypothetical protein
MTIVPRLNLDVFVYQMRKLYPSLQQARTRFSFCPHPGIVVKVKMISQDLYFKFGSESW